MLSKEYQDHIASLLDALDIPPALLADKCMQACAPAHQLTLVQTDADGREHHLLPAAAQAWQDMKAAAQAEGIVLEIVSAFRDLERQTEIIRAKQARGMAIETILTLSAAPGYSEHHTGRAIDINTPGCLPTEEEFERTEAFAWLSRHAGRFGFSLSYPRGNPHGFIYEPWHWCYQPDSASESRA